MLRLISVHSLIVGLLLTVASSADAQTQRSAWTQVRSHEGITSFQREIPGQALPAFRSRAVIEHDLWQLLAILEDVDRAAEWTAHCGAMKRLRALNAQEMLVYARMDAPWPVRDRDVVVRISVSYARSGALDVAIRSVDTTEARPTEAVVRMPHMRAAYHFRSLGPSRTEVEYELEVDPGGTLPDWLKTMVSRDLAHDTLDRLRARAGWASERSLYRQRAEELRTTAEQTGYRG